MISDQQAALAIQTYGDTVARVCFLYVKNQADTQDIFQDVFLKYCVQAPTFESPQHEKAWFIRVTINACKDLLKSFAKSRTRSLNDFEDVPFYHDDQSRALLQAVQSLPTKYKIPIYLHYYEGYTAQQISKMIGKSENGVYTRLSRGRTQLKQLLGGEDFAG